MAIRKRDFSGVPDDRIEYDEEVSDNVIEHVSKADDLRGTFDPANDPYPGSVIEAIGGPEMPRREALGHMSRILFDDAARQHSTLTELPKGMRVQDLLAMVRVPNNPGDNVERTYRERIKSPLTAIRAWCVESQGGSPKAVRECKNMSCPLWSFRMGKNTWRGRSSK